MAWEHDVGVVLSERLAKCEIVLVDEEPRGHRRLRRQRAELLLVGDGGPHQVLGHVAPVRDL